jgi:hypothetical protein
MFSKKRFLITVAIICVIVVSVFLSSHLHAISCTARSDCGSCMVVECADGGCISGASAHACLCNGIDITVVCEPQQ